MCDLESRYAQTFPSCAHRPVRFPGGPDLFKGCARETCSRAAPDTVPAVPSETALVTGVGRSSTEAAAGRKFARLVPSSVIWAGVAGATVIAVVLRAMFVGDQSLGYEEVFTAFVVSHSAISGVWHAVKATESTPPLYYLLTWLWVKLTAGHAAVALRSTSLLAGSVTVPISFLAVRSFVGARLALVVAWLCAISPVLVSYAIYARSYALVVLVATLSVWALGALLERQSWLRWTLWGAAAAACLWTHYFTIFLVVAEAAVLLVGLPRQRRSLLLCLAAVAVAAAPLWPLFLSQAGESARTGFISARPLAGRLEDIVRQLAMGTNVPTAWLEGAGIVLVTAATLFALVRTHRRDATRVLGALALIGAGLPILSALTGIDDHLLPRNILGVWICLAPLAAYGLTRLRGIPLLAYSVICIVTVLAVQSNWRYRAASDWRGASARLAARASKDPVAVMPGLELGVAALYLHRRPLPVPMRAADLWVMAEPLRGAGERALTPVANPPLAQLWGPRFRPVGEIDYRGFRLIHLRAPSPTTVSPAPSSDGPVTAPLALMLRP